MEHIFTDLKTDRRWAWFALICFVSLSTILAASPMTPKSCGIVASAAYLSLCLFFVPSLFSCARKDYTHLPTLCLWSFVLVLLGIGDVLYTFYEITGTDYAKYDRFLNVIPIMAAIWAAGVGWIVHYKLTRKFHRTANAFALVMEMRKSSEIIKRMELISKHFPPGRAISDDYRPFFSIGSIHKIYADANWDDAKVDQTSLKKAEAVVALKFMLNYFEFMAAGVKAGDLDNHLLLETISVIVTGVYNRAKPLVDFLQVSIPDGDGQVLAFEHLDGLSKKWDLEIEIQKCRRIQEKAAARDS